MTEPKVKLDVIITGPTRTGSTALCAFYHFLGYWSGWKDEVVLGRVHAKTSNDRAGLEYLTMNRNQIPQSLVHSVDGVEKNIRVIKHIWIYRSHNPWEDIDKAGIESPYTVVTYRELESMMCSQVKRRASRGKSGVGGAPEFRKGMAARAPLMIGQLVLNSVERNTSLIFLEFPRFVDDVDYTWNQLKTSMEGKVDRKKFYRVHSKIFKKEFVTFREEEKVK